MTKPFAMDEFNPSARILLGPGPGNVHYRVYQAMSTPVIGYLDPQLLACMDKISVMLRCPLSNPESSDDRPPRDRERRNGGLFRQFR